MTAKNMVANPLAFIISTPSFPAFSMTYSFLGPLFLVRVFTSITGINHTKNVNNSGKTFVIPLSPPV